MTTFKIAKWEQDVSGDANYKEFSKVSKDVKRKKNQLLKVKNKIKRKSKKKIINKDIAKNKINIKQTNYVEIKKNKEFINKKKKKQKELPNYSLNENKLNKKKQKKNQSLREKMLDRLKAAHFRYINEQIYTLTGNEAQKIFQNDPKAFEIYHKGYEQQINKWPLNPLDIIISSIKKLPKTHIIADFGCGNARLAQSVEQKVHSFDLVSLNDNIIACDMANVPLDDNSVDIVVFCLSLMGTNLQDFILEANRILKVGGLLKIAEVESRFEKLSDFIEGIKHYRFKLMWKDLSHNLFYFMDFKKETNIKNKKFLPTIGLLPCLYKKR